MRFLLSFCLLGASISLLAAPTKKTIALRITNNNTNYLDETTVYLDYGTTSFYNWQEDSKKIFNSNPTVPQIYTLTADNQECFTNGFGPFLTTTSISVGVKTDSAGSFSIHASILDNFDGTSIIRLHDKALGLFHDLRQGKYNFTTNAPLNTSGRFTILISYPVIINQVPAGCADNDGQFLLSQDTTVRWSQCLLYNASNNLVNSYTNISGNFNFTNLPEGNYLFAFTYGVYVTSIPVTLSGNAISINAIAYPLEANLNQDIQFFSTGRNISNYVWDFGDGSIITGIANPTFAYVTPGTYTVIVSGTNEYGCQQTDTLTINVSSISSVSNESADNMKVYFSHNRIVLEGVESGIRYYVTDLLGKQVATGFTQDSSTIDTDSFAVGLYIVSLRLPSGIVTRKIPVNK